MAVNDLIDAIPSWSIGCLIIVVVVWYGWRVRRRIYFLPWENLSTDENLNIGASLSEIFVAEIERTRRIHRAAYYNPDLWNDRVDLPFLERSADGFPAAIRHIEQLGGPGWFVKAIGLLPLFASPATVRGSIHRFGNNVRFQISVENARNPWIGVRPIIVASFEPPTDNLEEYPVYVKQFAHEVFLKLVGVETFRSTESFVHFTDALDCHLRWETRRDPQEAKAAVKEYDLVLKQDQGNAASLFNKAVILYTQYERKANKKAISAFQKAVNCKSADVTLRAQALGGLANAFCQERQRYDDKSDDILVRALQYAQRAYETEFGADAPIVIGRFVARIRSLASPIHRWFVPARGRASVVKALAYANQVQAENSTKTARNEQEQQAYQERAIELYAEATRLNRKFTVAYNNLGYLFLKRAEKATEARVAKADLRSAKRYIEKAIRSDPSYQHAYDNLGNIYVEYAKLAQTHQALKHLRRAITYFQLALSQKPTYAEALNDMAKAYVALALCRLMGKDEKLREDESRRYVTEAVRFRGEAVKAEPKLGECQRRCKNPRIAGIKFPTRSLRRSRPWKQEVQGAVTEFRCARNRRISSTRGEPRQDQRAHGI